MRLKFANTITLGSTIGDAFAKPAKKVLQKPIEQAVPAEYKKWVEVGINYACKSMGVSLAWMIQRCARERGQ